MTEDLSSDFPPRGAAPARTIEPGIQIAWRIFLVGTAVLCAGYLVRTIVQDPRNWRPHVAIGALLAGSSIGLAWLATRAWSRVSSAGLRWIVTLALVWHALFGVTMLAQRIATPISSNDDVAHTLWPHVLHAINSLE